MRDRFTVIHDNDGTFTDYSSKAEEIARDSFPITLLAATGRILIGFSKPFTRVHLELATPNSVVTVLNAEYYNGSTWENLTYVDETLGLSRSGLVRYDKPEDWAATSIDSKERFYISLTTDEDTVALDVMAAIVLLASDADMMEVKSNILDFLPTSLNSWVGKHVSARKDIVQRLRNGGNKKYVTGYAKDITEFDLLDYDQVSVAAKYLALSFIFSFEVSDTVDDKYDKLGKEYYSKYCDAMDLFTLAIDLDDNGLADSSEEVGMSRTGLTWA